MTYSTRRYRSSSMSERIGGFVVESLVSYAFDLAGAWMLMHGLHGMHVQTGFWPCFWVLIGVSIVVQGVITTTKES